ncbi:ATP-binding protein [Halobacteria archaeon AArc-m2/3/4]|uniref:histidine kinase n=1 Tax=Natronoglomus mannanivorans TaxID=2979990 RepID=A0AAP3E3N9_9EURY|nr:ATP-binding protein [Halobacteria archaeon AArc-xg1-1]MCU4974342.1 ATP-binding protein [Halobacteria archaeon AArc-m2/3/4]
MTVLLEEPTVVVGVGDSVRPPAVRQTLLEGVATELVVVDSSADALATIDERDDVGCIVTDRSLPAPERSGIDLCREVRDRDDSLPIVFYVDDKDEDEHDETPRQALNAGGSGYYTRSDPPEDLRRAVDDAIETYARRREAAEESEILTTLLEDIGVNVYVKDEHARYLRIADVPDNIDPADAIGRTDIEIHGDDDPEMARKAYEDDLHVVETGETVRNHDERYGDGRTAYAYRSTKIPWVDDEGTTKGLIGITVDISEFKRTETELEVLRDQFEKFSSNLRHDLQNPLQVAIGHLELGRETGDERSFDHAMDALERIEEIMTDLESIAKDESNELYHGTTSLSDTAESVWNVLHTSEATFANEIPASARTTVSAQTIRPTLENLFKNAVTHGGTDVTVRVGTLDDGFYVEDTGPGIPDSEREAVLEAGYTTSVGGSGMGLSIVSDVSYQQGWGLHIGESVDGGARFEITNFPIVLEPTADDRLDVVREDTSLELTEETAVGTLETGGGAEYDPSRDRWTVAADGDNIWRDRNDFYFVSTTVDNPVRIQGRVVDLEAVGPFSKAGFMIRDGLDEDATYGYVGATPEFGTEVLWRTRHGEEGISQHFREETPAAWFRVDLLDDHVTCFVSRSGLQWTPIDQRPIDRTNPVHVGLTVCSTVSGRQCEATFEDVSVFELETSAED